MKFSSRPATPSLSLNGLTQLELDLIVGYLCATKLGQPSPYSDVAYHLITKIEETFGTDFLYDAAERARVKINHLDDHMHIIQTLDVADFEIVF